MNLSSAADRQSVDRQSVILLGASNLTLGWKPVLTALQSSVAGPLDLRVSLGLGRSYVDWSGFWIRRLPGIVNCGLWDNLSEGGSRPPLVLVTDLGNDIVYSHEPKRIFETARICIEKILAWRSDARIVMTGLPLDSIRSLDSVRFFIVRSLLFPGCRMSFPEILDKSLALDDMIRQYALHHGFPCVIPERQWYGVDPIHVIPPLREKVFRQFFSEWKAETPATDQTDRPPAARLPTSAFRTIAGIRRQSAQPVFRSPELVISAW